MANILIIFGSTGGNTEITARRIREVFIEEGNTVDIQRVELSNTDDLLRSNIDLCVLACPTYGHGVLDTNFAPFYEKMKFMDLNQKQFAVVGLGDYKYDTDYHFESVGLLESVVKESNGVVIGTPLRILKSPIKFLDNLIPIWTKKISELLNNNE